MMQSASRLLLCASLLPLSSAALATKDDSQLWTNMTATLKLSDRWRLQEDLTARFSDSRNGLYDLESNTLFGYRLNERVTVWAGYTHDPQYSGGEFTLIEHRGREQITIDKLAKVAGGTFDARLRFEQRWRNGVDGTGWRFRPYLRYVRPFHSRGKTALVLSHEGFYNFNTTSFQAKSGFERMRNLIAVSTPLNEKVAAEVGYLNQYTIVRHGEDTMDHIASITFRFSLP